MNPEVAKLLGGTAILIYSIEELSKSIQFLAGSKLRHWINFFAGNRVLGLLLGVFLAVLLTSSGAVTVMLVGLANARLLTLEQIFSVSLGASVGTTFIVHLFTFQIAEMGMLLIAVGVFMEWFSSSDRVSAVARTGFSLGLMFFAMGLLIESGKALQSNEFFQFTLNYFKDSPLISLGIATVLTAVIRSSSAIIGLAMSVIVSQHWDVYQALPWVLGANLGTTATAFFASLRAGPLGKQAALGNLLVKMVGVVLALPFLRSIANFLMQLDSDVSRQIAAAHTLFNVALAILFFPFISLGIKITKRWVGTAKENGPFSYQYLDPKSLNTPELALVQAQREILRLSDTVEQMVERSLFLFLNPGEKEFESLKAMDAVSDFLNRGIKLYLTKLSQKEMAPEQVEKEFELLLRTNDLENIGDIVDKNIIALARKTLRKGYSFSREGWNEISMFHQRVVDLLRLSTAYFTSRDPILASKLEVQREQIDAFILDLMEQHVQRLHEGVKESIETTSVHLDVLSNLHRISTLSVNFLRVAQPREAA